MKKSKRAVGRLHIQSRQLRLKPDFFINSRRADYFSSKVPGSEYVTFNCLKVLSEDPKKSDAIIMC